MVASNPIKEIRVCNSSFSIDCYIYIPSKIKKGKVEQNNNEENSLIPCLPFKTKKPKEIYLRNINEMNGFIDYFFTPKYIKDRIKTMFKVIKEVQGKKEINGKKFLISIMFLRGNIRNINMSLLITD